MARGVITRSMDMEDPYGITRVCTFWSQDTASQPAGLVSASAAKYDDRLIDFNCLLNWWVQVLPPVNFYIYV